MNAKLVSIVLSLSAVTLIGVGCATQDDGDGAEAGDGALSADECTAKSSTEKASALSACQKANAFDLAGCEKPSADAYEKWRSSLDAAYQAVQDEIDPTTGGCKQNIDAMSCKDLLTSAGKDFAAAAGDQKACDVVRSTRKAKCDSDASDKIAAEIGDGSPYYTLMQQADSVEASYLGGVISCQAESAVANVSAATCPAQASVKAESAYLACRRQCPNIAGSPCTPDTYKGQDVQCGKLGTVSSALGLFCESGAQCNRTALCDKYDAAKSDADKINKSSGCTTASGAPGVLTPKLTTPANVDGGAPTGVTTVCNAALAPAPSAPSVDAGAPDAG